MSSKKLWTVLMMLVSMIAMAVTGRAEAQPGEYLTQIAQIARNSGDYEDWSLEDKRGMIAAMGRYGLIPQAEAERLCAADEREIDAFALGRYAFSSAPDEAGNINVFRIAWVELGPSTEWDNDTWVWYSRLMFEVGLWDESSDVDVCEAPGEEAIPPQEAVRLAGEHLIAQGWPREAVKGASCMWHYMTHASDVNRQDMVYCVHFRFEDGSQWCVFLRSDGSLR